jgi:hypothetical protein
MIKRLWSSLFVLFLVACSTAPQSGQQPPKTPDPQTDPNPKSPVPSLKNLGPAPELANEVWLNTDSPLRLADLRGQVVLIDMWTFG